MLLRFVSAGLALAVLDMAAPAQAHSHVSIGIGLGCCGYAPYYAPYYYGYPPPVAYYAPPPVTYYAPPPVVYVPPPTVVYAEPQALPANQSSPTFIDNRGRTCRNFETQNGGATIAGTACLQSDGTWRTVSE